MSKSDPMGDPTPQGYHGPTLAIPAPFFSVRTAGASVMIETTLSFLFEARFSIMKT